MENSIYGSPFPKLNPHVRYKTALERAGFDFKIDGNNSSIPSQNAARIKKQSANVVNDSTNSLNNSSNGSSLPSSTIKMKVAQAVPQNGSHYDLNDVGDNAEDLNPIERSFMMLTLNDTSSSFTSISDEHSRGSRSKESWLSNVLPNTSQGPPTKHLDRNELEANLAPHENLKSGLTQHHNNTSFHGIRKTGDYKGSRNFSNSNDELKNTLVTVQRKNKSMDNLSSFDESHKVSFDSKRLINDVSKISYRENDYRDTKRNIDDYSTSTLGTTLHVEELLSQLNQVTLSKDEQIDTTLQKKPNFLQSKDNNLHVPKQSDSHKLKKSSAYLSVYPEIGKKPVLSLNTPLPPVRKFEVNSHNSPGYNELSMNSSIDTSFSNISIANNQAYDRHSDVVAKDSIATAVQDESKNILQKIPHEPVVQAGDTFEKNQRLNHNLDGKVISKLPTQKHPAGSGPCRACGLEILRKGIYSRNPSELSGQWHRDCFRCVGCGLLFDKNTVCYIFEDEPYCQTHYHIQNNSICVVCNKFIEGACLENDKSERFHMNCLTCFLCKIPISSDYFILNDSIPICPRHDVDKIMNTEEKNSNEGKRYTIEKRRTRLLNYS